MPTSARGSMWASTPTMIKMSAQENCHGSASLAMTYCFNEKEQIPRRVSALFHQIQQLFRQRLFLTGNSLRNISSAGNFPIKGGGGSLHVGGQPQIANTQSEDR